MGGRFSPRGARTVKPDEADAAGQPVRLAAQIVEKFLAAGGDDVLRGLAQGDFHQRGDLDADLEYVGHQPANAAKDGVGRIGGPLQHLLHAVAEAVVAAAPVRRAPRRVRRRRCGVAHLRKFLLPGERAAPAARPAGSLPRPSDCVCSSTRRVDCSRQSPQFIELSLQGVAGCDPVRPCAVAALPRGGGGGHLAFQRAGFVAQRGGQPHLLQIGCPALLALAAKLIERRPSPRSAPARPRPIAGRSRGGSSRPLRANRWCRATAAEGRRLWRSCRPVGGDSGRFPVPGRGRGSARARWRLRRRRFARGWRRFVPRPGGSPRWICAEAMIEVEQLGVTLSASAAAALRSSPNDCRLALEGGRAAR